MLASTHTRTHTHTHTHRVWVKQDKQPKGNTMAKSMQAMWETLFKKKKKKNEKKENKYILG